MTAIPVIVCAKNEERALGAALAALLAACRHAEQRSRFTYDVCVVLDESTDGTADVVRRYPKVQLHESRGGKVEAQRTGLRARPSGVAPPFAIFCDADVRPNVSSILALSSLLDSRVEVHVATCRLEPAPPLRRTSLAAALHTYNLRRGFSSQRTWFNGKLFAIRSWHVPDRASLVARIGAVGADPWCDFDAGILIDDIYLSRAIVREHGPLAIAEAAEGSVLFRAPETWRGMNRYYRRMRRELERLDVLFPETAHVHRSYGTRSTDLLASAPLREKIHYAVFRLALEACKAAYLAERAWVRHVRRTPRRFWPAIEETKAW